MIRHTSTAALKPVLGSLAVHSLRSAADGELLRRFVDCKDEAAFRVIAERHGPMVLGVCRRALRSPQDAEDAFQATMLIFSLRAGSIRKSASLGSWMHGVAMRVAVKLRRQQARRQRRERVVRDLSTECAADRLTWAEFKTGLDEELNRLPEHYRSVLVLCYLEGQTRDEAALRLGLTVSALHGRLERGRKLLAARLLRRGLSLSAGLVPVALSPGAMDAAIHTASSPGGRPAMEMSVAPNVRSLANETVRGMTMLKTKWATAALICSAVLAVGVGLTPSRSPAEDGRDSKYPGTGIPPVRAPGPPTSEDDSLKKTLLDLDRQVWEAGARGDWRERQKFMADDLVSISVLGKYGKADAGLADQRLRNVDWKIYDPEVVRISPDAAVLTYRYDSKLVTNDGKLLETRKDYRVVYTWAHRNGGWVMVFCYDDHGRKGQEPPVLEGGKAAGLPAASPFVPPGKPQGPGNGPGKGPAAGASAIDIDLLKTKIGLAQLAVKEKRLMLTSAMEKNADKNQIELLQIELDRAQLYVKEAEVNLAAALAQKQPSPANVPGSSREAK